MFQDPQQDPPTSLNTRTYDQDEKPAKTGQDQAAPEQEPATQHGREPSYGGIRDMFAEEDDNVEDEPTGDNEKGRQPSYGGIREMFAEESDKNEDGKGHDRDASYGGVRQMELGATFGTKEDGDDDEDNNIP